MGPQSVEALLMSSSPPSRTVLARPECKQRLSQRADARRVRGKTPGSKDSHALVSLLRRGIARSIGTEDAAVASFGEARRTPCTG